MKALSSQDQVLPGAAASGCLGTVSVEKRLCCAMLSVVRLVMPVSEQLPRPLMASGSLRFTRKLSWEGRMDGCVRKQRKQKYYLLNPSDAVC